MHIVLFVPIYVHIVQNLKYKLVLHRWISILVDCVYLPE